MMERYKGYWISGSALSAPPNTFYWEFLRSVLKDGRNGSVVEVGRIQDKGITFDLAGVAAWYGMELSEYSSTIACFRLNRLPVIESVGVIPFSLVDS